MVLSKNLDHSVRIFGHHGRGQGTNNRGFSVADICGENITKTTRSNYKFGLILKNNTGFFVLLPFILADFDVDNMLNIGMAINRYEEQMLRTRRQNNE
jgi:hypothetical protein